MRGTNRIPHACGQTVSICERIFPSICNPYIIIWLHRVSDLFASRIIPKSHPIRANHKISGLGNLTSIAVQISNLHSTRGRPMDSPQLRRRYTTPVSCGVNCAIEINIAILSTIKPQRDFNLFPPIRNLSLGKMAT